LGPFETTLKKKKALNLSFFIELFHKRSIVFVENETGANYA